MYKEFQEWLRNLVNMHTVVYNILGKLHYLWGGGEGDIMLAMKYVANHPE